MATQIRTVALAGASGNLGSAILSQLVAANFIVTVLTRHNNSSSFPATVKVLPVDYTSLSSLTDALRGQDALVSTLASVAVNVQTQLVDAAVAAGVQRFIPSEFGSDTRNPLARKLPVYADKVRIQEHLLRTTHESTTFTYTCIFTGPFLDWGVKVGFLPGEELYDGGNHPFSVTRTSTIGKAVVAVLRRPAETRNRDVYVHEAVVTQRQLARLAGNEEWAAQAENVRTEVLEQEAYAELGKKEPNFRKTMFSFIKRAVWGEGYGGCFEKVDNELLGVEMLGEGDLESVVREYVK